MLLLFLGIVIYLIIDDVKHKKEREYTNKRPTASSNSALTQQVNNNLRIMNDCLNVVNTSTNVETVISRYDDLIDVLERLSKYENNAAVTFPREVPSEVMVRLKGEKSVIINNAISRAFDDTLTKSETLKTEKGRRNRLLKFFVQLDCITPLVPEESQLFIVKLIEDNGFTMQEIYSTDS